MTELDYAIEIINAVKPLHAEARNYQENVEFLKALKYVGQKADETLQIAEERKCGF